MGTVYVIKLDQSGPWSMDVLLFIAITLLQTLDDLTYGEHLVLYGKTNVIAGKR